MVVHDSFDCAEFLMAVAVMFCERYIRVKPEFGTLVFSIHVHMARFAAVVRTENGRHLCEELSAQQVLTSCIKLRALSCCSAPTLEIV